MADVDEQVLVPIKRGRGRPPKHGAYSKFQLAPLEDAKVKEIVEIMKGDQLAIGQSDMLFVKLLARLLAQIDLLDRWFTDHGLFNDIGKGLPWPVLGPYQNMVKQAGRMLEQLGMTTIGRTKLGRDMLQSEDIAMKIQRARQE